MIPEPLLPPLKFERCEVKIAFEWSKYCCAMF